MQIDVCDLIYFVIFRLILFCTIRYSIISVLYKPVTSRRTIGDITSKLVSERHYCNCLHCSVCCMCTRSNRARCVCVCVCMQVH